MYPFPFSIIPASTLPVIMKPFRFDIYPIKAFVIVNLKGASNYLFFGGLIPSIASIKQFPSYHGNFFSSFLIRLDPVKALAGINYTLFLLYP